MTDLDYLTCSPGAALPKAAGEVTRVETTTLLPGGSIVTLSVRRAGKFFEISDDGIGLLEAMALGFQGLTLSDQRRGRDLASGFGLEFDGQGFRVGDLAADQLLSAVAYVAEASRAWSAFLIDSRSERHQRDFVAQARERLRAAAPSLRLDENREIVGDSNKRHRFDIVARLPGDRLALFETVTPAPASIYAAHFKFFDVFKAHSDWPREAIIEDLSVWASEDLAAMQQVATHIRPLDSSWADLATLSA